MFFVGDPLIAKRVTHELRGMHIGIRDGQAGDTRATLAAPSGSMRNTAAPSYGSTAATVWPGVPRRAPGAALRKPGTGQWLEPGMTFTIEPMINAGRRYVRLLPDQWTVVTKDHSPSAQWEHTVLVTEYGFEVLTVRPGDSL
jgi:Xaa-Pro aminopeptidase